MSKEAEAKEGTPLPIWIGLALTILLIVGTVWLASGTVCDPETECMSRWDALRDAPSNEIGDTLAGVGSALAFIWLVITVPLGNMFLNSNLEKPAKSL